jgi:hypothetical protein
VDFYLFYICATSSMPCQLRQLGPLSGTLSTGLKSGIRSNCNFFFCKTGMIWYILSTNVVVLCYSILVPLQAVEPDVADLLCSRRRLTSYADGGGRDCLSHSRPSSSAAVGGWAPLQSEEAGAPVCLGSTSGGGTSPSAREWAMT